MTEPHRATRFVRLTPSTALKRAAVQIDATGPVVVDGMLCTNSGFGLYDGQPGNVLLAFALDPSG